MQTNRIEAVTSLRGVWRAPGMPRGFPESLFDLLIDATCRMEPNLIDSPPARSDPPTGR
jgi:hypothetical protein